MGLVHALYDRIRQLLPRKIAVHNGVAVRQPRLLDRTDHQPRLKNTFVSVLPRVIERGDTVVQVGGGYGMSTVIAAALANPGGRVHTYEASEELVSLIEEAAELNRADWRPLAGVEVHHAVVGRPGDVWGGYESAEVVLPADLPECDVLCLDCEGAELDIIEAIDQYPPRVAVEVHPDFGIERAAVLRALEAAGYAVMDAVEGRETRYLVGDRHKEEV